MNKYKQAYLTWHELYEVHLKAGKDICESLRTLRSICPHENIKEWSELNDDMETEYFWRCDDCGADECSSIL